MYGDDIEKITPKRYNFRGGDFMPTYDFSCKECKNKFTVKVSIKEKANVLCPKCNSKEIEQRFTRVNLGGIQGGSAGSSACSSGGCSSCSGC